MDYTMASESSRSSAQQNTPCGDTSPPNPYQRRSSRRAIACVTCAKAKTKCDKALPSCSRCITKGIKCDPRSTRRTSDNSYRANVKKPFVSPKRYHTTSNIQNISQHTSPRPVGSSARYRSPHFDFRPAPKMNRQASVCAGFPTLTPLPTYTSQTGDSCYAYPVCPDTDLPDMTSIMESTTFPISGRLTPQTPESLVYHEPLSIHEFSDQWDASQIWAEHSLGYTGLEFHSDVATMLPMQLWSASEHTHGASLAHINWHQSSLSASPHVLSHEMVPHLGIVPALSISECSVEDFNSASNFQDTWANCQPITTQLEMGDLVAPSPFVQGTEPSVNSVWEDVFMHGSARY